MKPLAFSICVWILAACASQNATTSSKPPTKNQYERLLAGVAKDPKNEAMSRQLREAYQLRLQSHMNQLAQLANAETPQDFERLLSAYKGLQAFYNLARAHAATEQLLNPGDVARQIADTKLLTADAWYTKAQVLLESRHWQSARQAESALTKLNRLYPKYKDAASLMAEAIEQSVIDVVVAPIRNEGFYASGIYGNGYGNGGATRLSGQLARDLGGRFASPSGRVRAFDGYEMRGGYSNPNPDVLVEPVWTSWQRPRENRRQYDRTLSAQVEIGRDSLNRPRYGTVTATLHIVEISQRASASLDLRLSDMARQSMINSRQWSENYPMQQRWATYSGDPRALGPADWELVRSPQGAMRPADEWIQQQILEKIYPELLQYLRTQLN
jgi:hypothetical protein